MARRIGSKRPEAQELLNREEAAAYLGLAPQTLAIWKVTGRYSLPVVKVGRLTKYRRSDLAAFLDQRTVDTSKSRSETKRDSIPSSENLNAASFAEVKLVESAETVPQPQAAEAKLLEILLPSGITLRLSDSSLHLLSSVMSVLERY